MSLQSVTFREEVFPEHILDQLDAHDAGLPDAPVSRHLLAVRQYPLSSPLQRSDHPYPSSKSGAQAWRRRHV